MTTPNDYSFLKKVAAGRTAIFGEVGQQQLTELLNEVFSLRQKVNGTDKTTTEQAVEESEPKVTKISKRKKSSQ